MKFQSKLLKNSVMALALSGALMPVAGSIITLPENCTLPQEIEFKINFSSRFQTIEYCPDNTCESLKISRKINLNKFKKIGIAYFFYLSNDQALENWKRSMAANKCIEGFLSYNKSAKCKNFSKKELARCEILQLEKESKIRVFFTRYDEHEKITEEIPLDFGP